MLVYHCKVAVAADVLEIMSFIPGYMTWLVTSGWLALDTLCRPGALI